MSNRTDFSELAREIADAARLTSVVTERIATELHNAFVAGQESSRVTRPLPRELPHPSKRTARDRLAATISDLISNLLYYDRKEDDNLPRGAIDAMVAVGDATVDEIVELFRDELVRGLKAS